MYIPKWNLLTSTIMEGSIYPPNKYALLVYETTNNAFKSEYKVYTN